ncbi:membrane protein [Intrasporangium oryzae NRRL B-24470]|uniref:Membrane protein n=1 Tax=Intrasporangium oryzae NRRL B-24470 TaxID=1386089 RepID=W9G7F0_9MICO|nr:zf-HC2 domain-containing protein [Intrasporangium oryzae]EWT01960.1 membrane protein [Intrasporangium oryzae NRRL B-24470]
MTGPRTPRTPWHVDDQILAAYAAGTTPPVLSASVEAHVLGCADCRQRLGDDADPQGLDEAWERLASAIDRPSPGILGRLGSVHGSIRSTIATPAMVLAALSAVALVVLAPLTAAAVTGDAGLLALLVIAPLAPVAAVALAYRVQADPAGEISLATPAAGLRLVALRAVVVSVAALVATMVTLLLVDLWVDLTAAMVLAWFLPGVALSAVVLLACTTRLDPLRVAGALGLVWAAAVVTGSTAGRRVRPEVVLDIIASPALQTAALVIATAAVLLTVARRDTVSYRRTA